MLDLTEKLYEIEFQVDANKHLTCHIMKMWANKLEGEDSLEKKIKPLIVKWLKEYGIDCKDPIMIISSVLTHVPLTMDSRNMRIVDTHEVVDLRIKK